MAIAVDEPFGHDRVDGEAVIEFFYLGCAGVAQHQPDTPVRQPAENAGKALLFFKRETAGGIVREAGSFRERVVRGDRNRQSPPALPSGRSARNPRASA